jgi:hypothetical protein
VEERIHVKKQKELSSGIVISNGVAIEKAEMTPTFHLETTYLVLREAIDRTKDEA